MIGTPTRLFIEVVVALLVLLAAGAGFLAWRLGEGPLSLDFLTPYIEQALADPASDRVVAVGDTILIWEPADRALAIRALDVAVTGQEGIVHAIAPQATMRFSFRALLRGRIEIVDIAIVRPDLRLVRETDGRWQFGMGTAAAVATTPVPDQPPEDPVAALLDPLLAADGPARSLESIRVLAAEMVIEDRQRGRAWSSPRATMALTRTSGGIALKASIEVDLGPGTFHTDLDAAYDRSSGRITGTASVDHIDLAAAAARLPEVDWLKGLDLVVGGSVGFDLARGGNPTDITFDARAGQGRLTNAQVADASADIASLTVRGAYHAAGDELTVEIQSDGARLTHPQLAGDGLEVGAVALRGSYRGADDRLRVDAASIRLGAATVTLAGTAAQLRGAVAASGEVRLADLPVDDLRRYWPPQVAAGARVWVLANLSRGTVQEAVVRFAARKAEPEWEVESLDGTMRFDGIRATYFGQLPPIEQASGTAQFDQRTFTVAVTGGSLRRSRVEEGKIVITGLQERDQAIAIEAVYKGSLADALFTLDRQPLGYMRRFNISPDSVAGDATARLTFRFPLIKELPIEKVQLAATGNVRGGRVPRVVRNLDLSDGDFAMTLDVKGMEVTGRGRLAGVPMAAKWTEHFTANPPFRRRFDFSGTVDDAQRQALGLGFFSDWATGPANATADYTELDGRRATMSGTVDLSQTKLEITEIAFEKPRGTQAVGRFELTLTDGRFERLAKAEIDGKDLTFRGSGRFGTDSQLASLEFQRFAFGESDVAGSIAWAGRDMTVNVTGRRADLTEIMAREDAAAPSDPAAPRGPRLALTARIDRVTLKPGRVATAVTGRMEYDGKHWRSGQLDGRIGEAQVNATLMPYERGRELVVTASDAGTVLRAFDISEYVLGGKLRLGMKFLDSLPTERALMRLEIDDYRVVRAPVLASVLAVASITGIPEMLTGEGIAFSSLVAEGVRTADSIQISEARAAGLAMGITVRGTIRRADEVADLTGTIVPIYAINRVIGSLPLIGDLLTGGPGGGLFAFTYAVRGPLSNPSVSVNPLSVLAPGFLRNLFFERRDGTASPLPAEPGVGQP